MMIRLTIIDSASGARDVKDISAAEADSLLSTLGVKLMDADTLAKFVERSAGNRISVSVGDKTYAFSRVR